MSHESLHLLCSAYLRINFDKRIETTNMGGIVVKYLGNSSCLVSGFKQVRTIPNEAEIHGCELILFKPDIPVSFLSLFKQYTLSIKLLSNSCNFMVFRNGGVWLQCGLIKIPKFKVQVKNTNTNANKNNVNIDNFKSESNAINFEKVFWNFDDTRRNTFDKILSKDKFFKDINIETYYLEYVHYAFSCNYRDSCRFGKNDNLKYQILYDSTSTDDEIEYDPKQQYLFECGGSIDMKMYYDKHFKEHFLQFIKNGNIIDIHSPNDHITHGNILLDFENNDYYLGVSSPKCGCVPDNTFKGCQFYIECN